MSAKKPILGIVGVEPTAFDFTNQRSNQLSYTIKSRNGIEPLLQVLQTHTLPLCYLTDDAHYWT